MEQIGGRRLEGGGSTGKVASTQILSCSLGGPIFLYSCEIRSGRRRPGSTLLRRRPQDVGSGKETIILYRVDGLSGKETTGWRVCEGDYRVEGLGIRLAIG